MRFQTLQSSRLRFLIPCFLFCSEVETVWITSVSRSQVLFDKNLTVYLGYIRNSISNLKIKNSFKIWNSNYLTDFNMSFPRRLKQFCIASLHAKYRSSGPEVFCKNGVLRNFAKFTGKHLWQGLFLNKVAERLWHMCFPVNFAKFLWTPLLSIEHLWWLFLKAARKINGLYEVSI